MTFLLNTCKKLALKPVVSNLAVRILQKMEEKRMYTNEHPSSVTACAIYIAIQAFQVGIDLDTISKAADCSETALRNFYKRLLPFRTVISDCIRNFALN